MKFVEFDNGEYAVPLDMVVAVCFKYYGFNTTINKEMWHLVIDYKYKKIIRTALLKDYNEDPSMSTTALAELQEFIVEV